MSQNTGYLSPELAQLADPELGKIHRIMEEEVGRITTGRVQGLGDALGLLEKARDRIKQRCAEEN